MYIPVYTSFYVALSTPHSIHTSQCTETICEVLNTVSDIEYKYLQEQDELYEQYKPAESQCFMLNVDCDVRDKLYDELIQVSEALNEVEKVLRLPQLEPYSRNYSDLCH